MKSDFCLYELGSTSLKFYYRARPDEKMRVFKQPWTVGREIFRKKHIPKTSIEEAISVVGAVRSKIGSRHSRRQTLAFATGAFRDAENAEDLVSLLRSRVGVDVRVLTGDEEARLLESAYYDAELPVPAFAFDLGGGSLQWVYIVSRGLSQRGSLRLGAVRLFTLVDGLDSCMNGVSHQIVDKTLLDLPTMQMERIHATGGTVKAIAKIIGKKTISRDELADLERRVRREGPPTTLKPHRQPIFLAGIVIVKRLLLDLGATTLHYQRLAVGHALLQQVARYYKQETAALAASTVLACVGEAARRSAESGHRSSQRMGWG